MYNQLKFLQSMVVKSSAMTLSLIIPTIFVRPNKVRICVFIAGNSITSFQCFAIV